jgi:hypothetical protein
MSRTGSSRASVEGVVAGAVVDEAVEVLDVVPGAVVTVVPSVVAGGRVDSTGPTSSPDLLTQAVRRTRKRAR